MECEICKRTSTYSKIVSWENRVVCLACKSHYYRKFEKVYAKILVYDELTFEIATEDIWKEFLSPKVCKNERSIENYFSFCENGKSGCLECFVCRFRGMFFLIPPPKHAKQVNQSMTTKQNYLKFKSWWRSLLKIFKERLENKCMVTQNTVKDHQISTFQNISNSISHVHSSPHLQNYVTNPINPNSLNAIFLKVSLPFENQEFCYEFNNLCIPVKLTETAFKQLINKVSLDELQNYYTNQRLTFTKLIATMLMNNARNFVCNNFSEKNVENIVLQQADYLFNRFNSLICTIQTYASVDENFIYQAQECSKMKKCAFQNFLQIFFSFLLSLGIYKETESQCLQRFIQCHGLKVGVDYFKLRRKVSLFLSQRSNFEVLLIQVKMVILSCIEEKLVFQNFCEMSRNIIETLNSQLDIFIKNCGLSGMIPDIRKALLERLKENESVVWYSKEVDLIYVVNRTE